MTEMTATIIVGLLIPLLGTMLGSAFVFFMKDEMSARLQKSLLGLCLRSDGSSIRVVLTYSGDGDEG